MIIQTTPSKTEAAPGGVPSALTRIGAVVADVLGKHGVTGAVAPDADLGRLGMTSIDMVELMLGLEAEFDLTIPPAEITLRNFNSVSSVAALMARLAPDA